MAACNAGASDDGAIATISYEGRTLRTYAPEPAEQNRQIDQMATRLYGPELSSTRSPKTPYICIWRNPDDPFGRAAGPPAKIFLACIFGSEAWTPPPNLIEEAELRARRDEAWLHANWERQGDGYRLVGLLLELRGEGHERIFRSVHGPDDLASIEIAQVEVGRPQRTGDPLTFRIGAAMPYRLNRGEQTKSPTISFEASGTAAPMPDWILY